MSDEAVYGIVGYPVEHSLSPLMHNAAFKVMDVPAVYKLFSLKEEELDDFFAGLKEKDSPIFGLNVTVPYKERVVQYLDTPTPLVQKLGVVNTIVISNDRKLIGYNTDAPGFLAHLTELGFKTAGKNVAILGAGGSARAILATLCMISERPDTIKIYNRSEERMNALMKELGERIDLSIVSTVFCVDDLELESVDLLINTTSVGMKGDNTSLIDEDLLHDKMLVYDLIYNPKETPLLKMAKQKGAQISNGLGMLYYQGVLSLQHWANVQLEDEIKNIMRESLEREMENL